MNDPIRLKFYNPKSSSAYLRHSVSLQSPPDLIAIALSSSSFIKESQPPQKGSGPNRWSRGEGWLCFNINEILCCSSWFQEKKGSTTSQEHRIKKKPENTVGTTHSTKEISEMLYILKVTALKPTVKKRELLNWYVYKWQMT